MSYQTDSFSYINAVKILLGEDASPDRLFRLSKPLVLFIPALLHQLLGLSVGHAFILQQIFFYWLSAILLNQILLRISKDSHIAYLGSMAYLLCQPIPVYGLAILTDSVGWFWAIAGIYASLIIFEKPSHSKWLGLGIFLGLGFFVKETIAVTGLFVFWYILLDNRVSIKQKIIQYSLIGFPFISTLLLGNLITYQLYNQSIIQWIQFGHSDPPTFSFSGFLIQSYHTLDVYWLLVLTGIICSRKLIKNSYPLRVISLTALSIWILLPLTWPYLYDRILFISAPFMVIWIAYGANYFHKMSLPLVFTGGLLNLLVSYSIYKHQISGLLFISFIIYIIIIGLSLVYKKRLAC